MNASSRRILRLGLTAGLSLGAIVGLVGCAEQSDDVATDESAAFESLNGLSGNGLSLNGLSGNGLSLNGLSGNGLSMNGISANGLSLNGLSMNGLSGNGLSGNGLSGNGLSGNGLSLNGIASVAGLSSTSGLMTTEGGREIVKYLVKVAFPAGHNLTKQDQYGNSYTFEGAIGIAPEFEFGTVAGGTGCGMDCQERVSGAMLAHVNNAGVHVGIWLAGPDNGIGWGTSPNYPYKEAGYFGNLFASNMPGNYCAGKDMGSGDAKGRLGSPFGNNSSILNSPYGWQWDGASQQNVPQYCMNGATPCTLGGSVNEGYTSCPDTSGTSGHPAWNHVVTVWRNFESTQLYRICNKASGKCLGVVGGSLTSGANVEQRTYTGAAGQAWKILQVSPGIYKIINKTSGMSLDLNGTQVVQRPYVSQGFPIAYLSDQPGFLSLTMSGNPTAAFGTNWSSSDGGLVQTTNQNTADCARWTLTAVALDTFDPGGSYRLVPQSATSKSVDIAYNNTNPGTIVQQYGTWNTNGQKFFIKDAGGGNVKFAMKQDASRCLGPVGGYANAGTLLEVQYCNGQYNQAWINVQTTSTSGIFIYRSAANPAVCMDVQNASANDGARIQTWTCNGGMNQRFAAVSAP